MCQEIRLSGDEEGKRRRRRSSSTADFRWGAIQTYRDMFVPDRPIDILEGLSATGLRSLRFAKETTGVGRVWANDIDPVAFENIKMNTKSEEKITATCSDVNVLCWGNKDAYDVIDLDPYGSPAQFLESAVVAIRDGGLLCITATDLAVLCGNLPEACYTKYGSVPLHAPFCHEQAIRILLYAISVAAARHRRAIDPLLSISGWSLSPLSSFPPAEAVSRC